MANSIKDNQKLMRSVQEACDELDRKEVENSILQKQKEDAEYVAEITTKANEELIREIRDLNYKSGLYGVSKKELEPREYERHIEKEQHEHHCEHCKCEKNKNNEINVRFPWFKERKSLLCGIIGIIVILLLSTGFTPSGEFWTAVQDQWISLIADVFRITLVVIACLFVYNGIIKK